MCFIDIIILFNGFREFETDVEIVKMITFLYEKKKTNKYI